jgi:fatty-acyl-CoA synthase
MHTGDLATMDDDGYVNIVGRIKDVIIRGGENVYPREIEEFLYTHPDIADIQVIGVPDDKYGEEIMAWVKPRDGASVTEDAVRDFCRGRIAGKIQKFKMREQAIAELGLESAAAIETA